ncbi:MAG: S-layer homology domain-containing protein [Flavonifractor sp.]|nr:S-layer homology domain-containing protein [Flavonifractor sp.]
MKTRVISVLLTLVLCLGTAVPAQAAAPEADQQQAYQAILAMKEQYPEGTPWTNDNHYAWNAGIYSGGYGCVAFAFLLSDAAFGDLPARMLTEFSFLDVSVGDILRINDDTHSVVVLEVHDDHVVIAEGNYNRSIHWGRTLTAQQVLAADNLITRYPESGTQTPDVPSPEVPAHPFQDVPGWCSDAVSWAVSEAITTGTSSTTFSPDRVCANADILTFLWRSVGSPDPAALSPLPLSGDEWYANAVHWAYGSGIIGPDFDPNAPCTRIRAITFLWQALDNGYYTGSAFSDVTAASAGMDGLSAVAWAVQNGITSGTSDTTFSPDKVCSRGEIVTFLHRACVPSASLKEAA